MPGRAGDTSLGPVAGDAAERLTVQHFLGGVEHGGDLGRSDSDPVALKPEGPPAAPIFPSLPRPELRGPLAFDRVLYFVPDHRAKLASHQAPR
jgi:hypothetical protein